MNTFLPYADFQKSAQTLDMKRLGKQRVEAFQILNLLRGVSISANWRNHPAVLMWKDYEIALAEYGLVICEEWIKRGYKDTMLDRFLKYKISREINGSIRIVYPWWFDKEAFHKSHQSNLLRKDYGYYWSKFDVGTPDNLPYIWPVRLINGEKVLWKP